MITTPSWPQLAAPLLNAIALLLALGFHRNRAVMVLAILTCASLALGGFGHVLLVERGMEAARMFAPCLLLGAAAMPERRLRARRNLVLLGLLAIAVWLTLMAPAHIWPGLREAFPLGWLPWNSGTVAAGLVLVGAVFCMVRWIIQRSPMDAALSFVLVVSGIALLPSMQAGASSDLLAVAGAIALFAILLFSYNMAFVDGLAGVPNRRSLDEALTRLSGDYAVAMIDVDHFKAFNDRHGHGAGDRVLKAIAEQLKLTRGGDPYRYGGEEFCLLFTGTRARDAAQACEDLRARVAKLRVPVRSVPSGKRSPKAAGAAPAEVKVTISIGLARRANNSGDASDVLKAADRALYKAKAAGRNRVVDK
ncbi:MAG: GGDEF domain-containing protein [Dokdonella sp.]|uniref:diguanylate cyclase n=1 Tax=Dokdonella sp. TaxID=2291710 RepID=UPI003BAF250F